MQRKDLALRVLSTAAIMSIVTSIAAPAFAGTYYMGNGNLSIRQDENGKVYVKSGDTGEEKEDTDGEVIICGGAGVNQWSNAPSGGAVTGTEGSVAGESQPDPDAAFTLNETEEDSAQNQEGNNPTENPTEDTPDPSTENPTAKLPKKDVVYQYDPTADPETEQQATKPTLSTSAAPTAETREATQADAPAAAPTTPTAPAADPPAEGSADNPTTNVIKVVNNWVDKAAKELKIRLSNVNIKVSDRKYEAAMDISGGGKTKIELDGQNRLDNSQAQANAGLRKQGEGTLIITDETNDEGKKITTPKSESDTSGSLTAKGAGGNGAAGIGGNTGESTKNITIEGYATVDATGGGHGAGIGGGGGTAGHVYGDAENIIIRGHSKVTATAGNGAAIGGGSANGSGNDYVGGSAKGIVIRDYATVVAKNNGYGAAIGAAGGSGNHTEAVVTIGTPGATAEDVHVTATGSNGSAIGNGRTTTNVTIQGHATVQTASSKSPIAIGSYYGNVEVNIKDNASIDTATGAGASGIGGGDFFSHPEKSVVVTINGGENGKIEIGKNSAITGKFGAISATKVNISNNVLLKMKQWASANGQYISVNGAEAAVGKRSDDPTASGLVNSIGDNTELWYTDFKGVLQKIVHGKNVCKKKPGKKIGHEDATCGKDGYDKYQCDYEHDAKNPSCDLTWQEVLKATGNHLHTEIRNQKDATCTEKGYTGDTYCTDCNQEIAVGTETPVLGHKWHSDNDATHSCERGDKTEAHSYGEWTTVTEATCTTAGKKQHTCTVCNHVETKEIPVTGHHWKDNGDGTHTCTKCGATEGQPVNTNSALELRVVDAEGMDQPFTVSQNGTLRTYTGAYDTATLTGDLDTLRYLQDHGAQTIQFVTNGQTSSFAINDLLAQGSGSEVFYLTHRGAEEPTLLLVEADHSELVKD